MLQFPPSLYHYITEQLHKQVILVLNKVDLCPAPLVVAWKHYMMSHFPDLQMVCFTSHPREPNSAGEERRLGHACLGFKTHRTICWLSGLQKKRMRRKAGWGKAGGPLDIMKACQEITAGKGNPASQSTRLGSTGVWLRSPLCRGMNMCSFCSILHLCALSRPLQLGAEDSEGCSC